MANLDDALKIPVMSELTDTERKIKNNLIAFSCISLFMFFCEVDISGDSSILGLKFIGLTQDKINIGLFLVVLYSAVHYSWYVKDAVVNLRLRLTAVAEMKAGLYGSFESVLELEDKRNNTIYHWWCWHKRQLSQINMTNDTLIKALEDIEELLLLSNNSSLKEGDVTRVTDVLRATTGCVNSLTDEVQNMGRVFNSSPIERSLIRFNTSFRNFLISGNIRWIIFEFILPFALAFGALYCLALNLFHFGG